MAIEQLNQVKLIGIVGNSRVSNVADRVLVNFSLATNLAYKDKDNNPIIETTWHNCSFWSKEEDSIVYNIRRGTAVSIIGRIRQCRYCSSDGEQRSSYEILVNHLEFPIETPTVQTTRK